jgi:hypothetical protein
MGLSVARRPSSSPYIRAAALLEVINADRDDGGVAHAKSTYREHNWFTLRTTSGLEFTTRADGFNVTEHRSAPSSVALIAATKRAQSMLERARADRSGRGKQRTS